MANLHQFPVYLFLQTDVFPLCTWKSYVFFLISKNTHSRIFSKRKSNLNKILIIESDYAQKRYVFRYSVKFSHLKHVRLKQKSQFLKLAAICFIFHTKFSKEIKRAVFQEFLLRREVVVFAKVNICCRFFGNAFILVEFLLLAVVFFLKIFPKERKQKLRKGEILLQFSKGFI